MGATKMRRKNEHVYIDQLVQVSITIEPISPISEDATSAVVGYASDEIHGREMDEGW